MLTRVTINTISDDEFPWPREGLCWTEDEGDGMTNFLFGVPTWVSTELTTQVAAGIYRIREFQ